MVIACLLGTNPYPFDRLVSAIDRLAIENNWEVFIQLGNANHIPEKCSYQRFLDRADLTELIKTADVVITQGGFGSIRDALRQDKPVIAVPRDRDIGESVDDQGELVKTLQDAGLVIGVWDTNELEDAIRSATDFTPGPRPGSRIPAIISEFTNSLAAQS